MIQKSFLFLLTIHVFFNFIWVYLYDFFGDHETSYYDKYTDFIFTLDSNRGDGITYQEFIFWFIILIILIFGMSLFNKKN